MEQIKHKDFEQWIEKSAGLRSLLQANTGKICAIDDKSRSKNLELVQVQRENEWIAECHCIKLGSFEDKVGELFHRENGIINKISNLELKRPGNDAHWHFAQPELIHDGLDKEIMPLAGDLIRVNEILRQIDQGIYVLPAYEVPSNYRRLVR